ncbi:unnamed protein product [Rhizopus microsporus]
MNNQMNNCLIVNDEGVQRMIDNNLAMYYSNQMIIAQNMTHQPVNTIKAYSAKQEELKKWCLEQRFGDGEIVTDQKLGYFLPEYVMNRGRKLRRSPNGTPIALGRESVLAYVKAIADIYSKQKALGLNPHGPARGPLVRTFLDTLEKEKVKSKRQNFEDRGKNTLNDGYTKQELEKVSDYFLTEKNGHLGCRDRFCFLVSHAMLCRSQTALGMQFADLFSLVLESQGVSECIALIATIIFGKTNQHCKIEYGSSVRHHDVEVCSVGALAMNLFSRFHFENEPFPDFTRRENWYETMIFKGDDRFTPITYRAQHKIYQRSLKRENI